MAMAADFWKSRAAALLFQYIDKGKKGGQGVEKENKQEKILVVILFTVAFLLMLSMLRRLFF